MNHYLETIPIVQKLGLMGYCLENPPLEGTTRDEPLSIQVVEEVSVRMDHKCQVMVVQVKGWGRDSVVAKVYDPLYADDPTEDSLADMPVAMADFAYCNEVKWYRLINSQFGGEQVPEFLGSYTMDVAFAREKTRPVRLILMEHIKGVCMRYIEDPPCEYTQSERQSIMSEIIHTESLLWNAGVDHQDLRPQNVIISGRPGEPEFRVTVLDFDVASSTPGPAAIERLRPYAILDSTCHRWMNANKTMGFRYSKWIDWDWNAWVKTITAD